MTQDERPRLFEPDPVLVVPADVNVADVVAVEEEPIVEAIALDAEPVRRANPWLIGLWSASLVLTVVAGWSFVTSVKGQYFGSSIVGDEIPIDVMLNAIAYAFAPGVFVVGLASALAAASIHAVQWMRRHP